MKAPIQIFHSAVHAQLLLLLVGIGAWFGVIHQGIVDYDTAWLMKNNPFLADGDFSQIPTIWTNFEWDVRRTLGAEYLPVRDTDILIDFWLFGERWEWHHFGNMLWYLMGCGLFLGVCRHILGPGFASWGAAALFCLHPIHVENVAWLASRKDLLGFAFFMGAWWLWLVGRQRDRISPLVFLLFILGYWSKNTTIVLPAVLFLCERFLYRKPLRSQLRHWACWVVVALPLVLISTQLGQRMRLFGIPRHDTVWEGISIQSQLWFADLGRLFWPTDLALAYPEPIPSNGLTVLFGSLICVLAALVWRWRNTLPIWGLGIGIFFATSLPTTVFSNLQNLSADRYLLLPSIGIALSIGAILKAVPTQFEKPSQVGLAILCVLFLWMTQQQSRAWRNNLTLWESSAEAQPTVLSNLDGYAAQLADADRASDALTLLNKAEKDFKTTAKFYQSRGQIHRKSKDIPSAAADYRRALQLDPDLRISGRQLAILLDANNQHQEALALLRRVTRVHPRYQEGHNTLGAMLINAYNTQKDPQLLLEAEKALHQAEELGLDAPDPACNLGGVYWLMMKNDPTKRDDAVWWWTKCKKRAPHTRTPPDLDLPI